MSLEKEIGRRRTFAIISHPDAGKTTMTEKLLLRGGAIHLAGEVHGKKNQKKTVSDFMKIEQERGISVSTSVMQFEYNNFHLNLLDTPGHADFGEDTYRTLTAVDNAMMVIDNAKGVESQTKKLYEVCKMRNIPLYTFINKMDRPGRDPFELLDEVEKLLHVGWWPITWPIGMGDRFKGVYDRIRKKVYLYEHAEKKGEESVLNITDLESPELEKIVNDDQVYYQFLEEIELLNETLGDFDHKAFLEGKITAVLFGSARYDFGVDRFVDFFCETSAPPLVRNTSEGTIYPTSPDFTGFVFKIQANLDPNHRDRIAFIRIISGKFERGMTVKHARLGTQIRLAYSQGFFANKRETTEEAFAGDILGIHDTGNLQIGDTLYNGKKVVFEKIPTFPPELFAKIQLLDPLKRKQLAKGIQQLCEEGTIQKFIDPQVGDLDPILAAVGQLQFEVFIHRLREEYKVEARLLTQGYACARWISWTTEDKTPPKGDFYYVLDLYGRPVALFEREWDLKWAEQNNKEIIFHEIAPLI